MKKVSMNRYEMNAKQKKHGMTDRAKKELKNRKNKLNISTNKIS